MFDSIKAFGEVFKGTFLVFPDKDHPSRDAEVVFYLGEHEDGISKGKAEELLGPAVWTGRISGDKTISTKGILGDVTRWNQLSGAMNVSIADYVMGKSIEAFGPFGIKEADDDFNAIARTCIQGMVSFYGAPLMGFVNIHNDGDREAVTGGDKSPFFAVPETAATSVPTSSCPQRLRETAESTGSWPTSFATGMRLRSKRLHC